MEKAQEKKQRVPLTLKLGSRSMTLHGQTTKVSNPYSMDMLYLNKYSFIFKPDLYKKQETS